MTLVWAILGGLLISVVASVCLVYFVVRPLMMRRVKTGTAGLVLQLHGREPLLSGAASCTGTSDDRSAALKGLGALALTEYALVFVSGSTSTPLIVARDTITHVGVTADLPADGKLFPRAKSVLLVRWSPPTRDEIEVSFTLDDPGRWAQSLSTPVGSTG